MSANVLEVTDDNWKSEVLDSSVPVMVDFWAPWCGPCRMLAPTIEKLAADYEGKVKVGKMNTDENQEMPGGLRISAIPTVLIFQAGKEVARLVGVNTESKFKAALAKALKRRGPAPPPEHAPPPPDSTRGNLEDSSNDEVEEALERNLASRQGFRLTKELRQAIELYAMDAAKQHFEAQGYQVSDHSKAHPYDLHCRHNDDVLYVEGVLPASVQKRNPTGDGWVRR